MASRCLGRSATGTFNKTAEGEGVEPSRLIAQPVSNRVSSPVDLPFRVAVPSRLHLRQSGPAVTTLLIDRVVKEREASGRLPRPLSPSCTVDRPRLRARGSQLARTFSAPPRGPG